MFTASFTVQNFLQLIFYLVILVVVLIVTYFVTMWIAGNQKRMMSGNNFEVIETLKVTNNKFLQIVRVGIDEYFVIAVGKEEIHMLGKLDKDKINFTNNDTQNGGFSDILASFKDKMSIGGDKKDVG